MSFDDELLQSAEDDAHAVEFIQDYLPPEVKGKFSEEELFYFLDVLYDYYATSGALDADADSEGFINVNVEVIAQHLADKAKKEGMGSFAPEELQYVVEAELEYTASN